jgi:type IV secretion system protein VirB8
MMRDSTIEQYLSDAQNWEADLIARAERSKRLAFWLAGGMGALATLSILALALLVPLKHVEPFVIRVDNTTGITDVVPVYAGKGEIAEVVTRHLLHNYVTARERYFYAMAEQDYNVVGAFNSPQMNTAWLAAWDRNNVESPLVKYKDGTTVRSQVKAVSFINRADGTQDLAQVRFVTGIRPGGAGAEKILHWIATIQYTYVEPSKDEAMRGLNPLGFRVLDYRREPEVVPEPASAVSPPVSAVPASNGGTQ